MDKSFSIVFLGIWFTCAGVFFENPGPALRWTLVSPQKSPPLPSWPEFWSAPMWNTWFRGTLCLSQVARYWKHFHISVSKMFVSLINNTPALACVCVGWRDEQRKTEDSWVKAKPSWLHYFWIWKYLIHPNFEKLFVTVCWNMKRRRTKVGIMFVILS